MYFRTSTPEYYLKLVATMAAFFYS